VTSLQLRDVWYRYGTHPVLRGVDLEVAAGSFTAVLGPSGSGKTTLLRVVAGFERVERGEVRLGSRVVDDGRTRVPPERRRVGYVPQDGALFPHLTVAGNIGFGLSRVQRRSRIGPLLEMVGLAGLEGRYAHQLSGGQQQRVALARALAIQPEVVLLDEPFSALDATMRAAVRTEVAAILRRAGATTLLVTHDQDEALSMADQVAVLRDGGIVAHDRPQAMYQSPVDPELASFLGDANLVPGVLEGDRVRTALGSLALVGSDAGGAGVGVAGVGVAGVGVAGGAAVALVRPEQIEVVAGDCGGSDGDGGTRDGGLRGRVLERAYFGHDAMLRVDAGDGIGPLLVRVAGQVPCEPGAEVTLVARGPVTAWPAASAASS
jgi:iron(III) transport system ATP-binding protein